MPSKALELALRDILHHIDLAEHFAAGLDYASFRGDVRTLYAVTRCLGIISEASRRLADEMKARHASIAWSDMAAAANTYRHEDEDAAYSVWIALKQHLPPLRAAVAHELERLGRQR
ncbi:MAG TPA: HepT-like ribonuclease domain-containing protein [Methylocystis sp.]|nr:HepT-like ribonuclease domain-containing protein [Methylocystis sp.]